MSGRHAARRTLAREHARALDADQRGALATVTRLLPRHEWAAVLSALGIYPGSEKLRAGGKATGATTEAARAPCGHIHEPGEAT